MGHGWHLLGVIVVSVWAMVVVWRLIIHFRRKRENYGNG
jgi:hypothetical protein